MQKQTSQFAVVTEKGSIKQVGRSTIWQPKTDYKGAGTKWYPEKYKDERR